MSAPQMTDHRETMSALWREVYCPVCKRFLCATDAEPGRTIRVKCDGCREWKRTIVPAFESVRRAS